MKRRPTLRSALKPVLAIAGVAILIYIGAQVITFLNMRDRLPRNTFFADMDVSGQTVTDAISKTESALNAPIVLELQSQRIPLSPAEIDFRLDEPASQAQLDDIVEANSSLTQLPQLLLRQPLSPTRVGAVMSFSAPKLDAFLNNLAKNIDKAPEAAAPNLDAPQVAQAQPGLALNMDESRQLILNALTSTVSRTVTLPTDVLPVDTLSVKSLEAAIQKRLNAFIATPGNVAGVFIKDMRTGEELGINTDVAFSGQGWLKLALVVETYRLTQEPIPPQIAQQLDAIALQGSNATANDLLRTLGQGDAQIGINQLNDTLRKLGLLSTYLAQPFGQDGLSATFVTPANARTDAPPTSPDPNAQTTLAQMGALLETIEQFRNGVGALPLAFEGAFSPSKCTDILDLLSRNRINALIEAGSPGASVAHRQSWDQLNHGDAALVRSAGRTYIIVVMLHGAQPLNWADTSVVIADIARLSYALFNNQMPPAVTGITSGPAP